MEVDILSLDYLFRFALEHFLLLVVPFLMVALVVGVASNIMQVGFLVSSEAIQPQMNRINPVEGFKRIFSVRALFELVKSLLKISIIGLVSYSYLRSRLPEMLELLGQESGVFAMVMKEILQGLALRWLSYFYF